MKQLVKQTVFYWSKWMGLFRFARRNSRNGLRILCYHAFTDDVEWVAWRPKLFTLKETLRRRLEFLHAQNYSVLPLDTALDLLYRGKLPPQAVAITIDDGFVSTKTFAQTVLQEYAYPHTIYLTSYYSAKQTPVFNLAVQYMLWKTLKSEISVKHCGGNFSEVGTIASSEAKDRTIQRILKYLNALENHDQRCELLEQIGKSLEVEYTDLDHNRVLSLLSAQELRELVADGTDLQLHTHRHRWPSDRESAMRELRENKAYLEPLTGKPPIHFCYPSGDWSRERWSYLEEMDIESATTCDPGVNDERTPRLALKRFLDSEYVSHIEFEAMLCGFADIIHRYRARFHW